jgi:signal transduction histidine kinase
MVGTELDITERKRLEEERAFLAEVGSILAATLELEATLTSIGELVTRALAEVCVVHVVEGEACRVKVAARDPSWDWIRVALEEHPIDRRRVPAIWSELEAHRSVLVEHASPELVASLAGDEAHLRALRAMDPGSLIVVPLVVRQKLVGAMVLVRSASSHAYAPADVRFAEQIAQRAALAIENARLYAEARRAVRARDEVLGIVAHDLRNPLGTILLQAERLRHPGAAPAHWSPIDAIERSADRMSRLIQDLLDVTRMEAGRLSVERARVAAGELVGDCVEAQRPLAAAASVELRADVAGDLPELWADRHRLQQVFENLIGNAIKFTAPGGAIVVGAAPRDGAVLFRVADTGRGIAGEAVPHVFDRFWQAGKAGRRGAGLGLPIAKGIVEVHGGRIWVESTPGRGSTFFFTIPTAP